MSRQSVYLGVKYGGNDTAAALMIDGEIVAACEQERYTGDKHSRRFPSDAIADCLAIGGVSMDDVTELAFVNDTIRMLREIYLRPALTSHERIGFMFQDMDRLREYWNMEQIVRENTGYKGPLSFNRHHLCHAASTYFPSGFPEALILSIDGMGELESGILATGRDGQLAVRHDANHYPHSLGLAYSAVTDYLGWLHHCDEGIVMGLAPFGDPEAEVAAGGRSCLEVFRDIIRETGPYEFVIDPDWMDYFTVRDKWVTDRFLETFGPRRAPGGEIEQRHKDIAAALQVRLEEIVLAHLARAREDFGLSKLCIAGGVGLNCKLNGKIEQSGLFDEIFVQPASGDNGCAVGACYLAAQRNGGVAIRRRDNTYLGSRFTNQKIEAVLRESGQAYRAVEDASSEAAAYVAEGRIVGWFQGAAEFGPRALGNRSIICRPFPESMKDHINARVKFREDFRPFAPAVLAERTRDYFELGQPSPHMLIASQAVPERQDEIAAVVHVDGSCRAQTVTPEQNPRFYRLIARHEELTGCPVVLNTSFNVKGEPIVNTPRQALDCFLSTRIDCLVIGDFVVEK